MILRYIFMYIVLNRWIGYILCCFFFDFVYVYLYKCINYSDCKWLEIWFCDVFFVGFLFIVCRSVGGGECVF